MEAIPYSRITKGSLLLASPDIDAGIYFRGVLLVCEHGPNGSFALMINKHLNAELPEDILNTKELVNQNIQIRIGGPIQPNQMMLLHSSDRVPDQTLKICDEVYLGGDLHFLQESVADSHGPKVRLCFGYAGWGPGQLEKEFLSGIWFLHLGNASHIFHPQPEKLWQQALREMGGKYATLAMMPEDPSVN
jgi:putative transcriptional regulator